MSDTQDPAGLDPALVQRALLPTGLRDLLPPDAAHEAAVVERLVGEFGRHGYDRVKPPLIEFEEGLLSGPGAKLANQTFRLMDPVSQHMMGVRSDMTLQVARIATTRLHRAPRPLRLSYAGQVLRVKGSQLRPERQFGQAGAELIGAEQAEGDAEIILMAASALHAVGARGISIDLTMPTLVPAVCRALGLSEAEMRRARDGLDRRDAAAVAASGGPVALLLERLMAASGPADRALDMLNRIDLPAVADADRQRLNQVVALIHAAAPDLVLTIDPVEQRGFEYHTGLSFTLFARDVRGELGRGGRYLSGEGTTAEPAIGFTLYTDTVLRAIGAPPAPRRLLLPHGTAHALAARLRDDGWQTVAALEPLADPAAEARRLGCGHVFLDGAVRPA